MFQIHAVQNNTFWFRKELMMGGGEATNSQMNIYSLPAVNPPVGKEQSETSLYVSATQLCVAKGLQKYKSENEGC